MLTRNQNNHFAQYPAMGNRIQRTKFPINSRHKTTMDSSVLVPLKFWEVLPGDTISMDMSQAVRMATPIFPVMDTAFFDSFAFYVPHRILWTKFKEFFGENLTPAEWATPTEYEIPQIKSPAGGWKQNTLADYLGLPTNVDCEVSHLPFRAYCMIWNEYFKNQMTKTPAYINLDETTLEGKNEVEDYVTDIQLGGGLLKVARFHDYFTSAAIQPSRGGDVMLPIGNTSGLIPVIAGEQIPETYLGSLPVTVRTAGLHNLPGGNRTLMVKGEDGSIHAATGTPTANSPSSGYLFSNMWADAGLTNGTTGASTMAQFFQAYAVQNLLYREGVMGTRYRSLIKAHFDITIADSRAQVPEYLGGARYHINMDQVVQTSATNETSPQGNVAGYSLTSGVGSLFTKSIEEPGIIMVLGCIRNVESYQQGIEKYWSKKSRFDFYYPELANLAEQAILNKEIYAQGTQEDEEVFGYQEAWADYKYKPSTVTGAFRSNYEGGSLDSWHYANYFTELPTLTGLNDATSENIERTLAVQNEPQFICDFMFKGNFVRPMPAYSIPGLRTFM